MRYFALLIALSALASGLCAQAGTWQLESPAAWSARGMHASVVFNGKLWVLGGFQDASVWSSTDGQTWTQALANAPWGPRYGHAAVVYNNHIWIFGGISTGSPFGYQNDVWYSPDGVSWGQATAAAPWIKRSGHGAVVHNNRMWIMGGSHNGGYNDVWWSTNGVQWTQETSAAPWVGRGRLGAVAYNGRMWVTGGLAGARFNDVWSSPDGATWKLETNNAAWSKRYGHAMAVYNDKMWVVAGDEGGVTRDDAWSSTDGVHWSLEMNGTAFAPRQGHTCTPFKNKLWVTGGILGSNFHGDVWSCIEPPSVRLTLNVGLNSSFFPSTHNLVAMDLNARAHAADSTLTSIAFTYTGSMPASSFTNIELFLDNNNDGWVDGGDTSLGVEMMFSSRVTFTGAPLVSLPLSSTSRLLLAVSTSSSVTLHQNISFRVNSVNDVSFGSGTDVTQYPLVGGMWAYEGTATRQFGPMLVGSSSSFPFNFVAGSGRFQTAYAAGELLAPPGTLITTVRVLGTNTGPTPVYGQLRLRMAHTSLHPTGLTGIFDDNYSGTLQECLGPVDMTPTKVPTQDGAWYVFPLSKPFVYNGTQGILIDWSYASRSDVGFLVGFDEGRTRIHVNNGSAFSTNGIVADAGNYGLSLTMFPPGSVSGLLISRPLAAAIPSGGLDNVTGTAFTNTTLLHYEALNIGASGVSFTGTEPVTVTAGAGAPHVVVTQQPSGPLAASGGLSTFEIAVTPAALGTWSASVTVLSTDAYSPYTFTITGVASTPNIPVMEVRRNYVHVPDGGLDVHDKAGLLGFSLSYKIHNTGTGVLNLTGPSGSKVIIVASTNCTVLVDQPLSDTIAINGYTTFGLFVHVDGDGPFSFTVEVANNDPARGQYTWTYNGDHISFRNPPPGGAGGCSAQGESGSLWLILMALAAAGLAHSFRKRAHRSGA